MLTSNEGVMTVFVGEPIEILLAYFQCRTHMSGGAYEPMPGKVLQSTIERIDLGLGWSSH